VNQQEQDKQKMGAMEWDLVQTVLQNHKEQKELHLCILWFTEHGHLLTQQSKSQELHGYLLPPNLGILLLEIFGQA
jgi:hypothetical protein